MSKRTLLNSLLVPGAGSAWADWQSLEGCFDFVLLGLLCEINIVDELPKTDVKHFKRFTQVTVIGPVPGAIDSVSL